MQREGEVGRLTVDKPFSQMTRDERFELVIECAIDTLIEVGNGVSEEDLHTLANVLLWLRDGGEPAKDVAEELATMAIVRNVTDLPRTW